MARQPVMVLNLYLIGTQWGGTDPTVQCYHEPIISTNRLSPTGTRSGITFALIVLQPRSKGWVRLADNDPLSMPLINPNFMMEEYDINTAVQAVKDIRKVMKQQSLCDLIEEEVMPGSNIKVMSRLQILLNRWQPRCSIQLVRAKWGRIRIQLWTLI